MAHNVHVAPAATAVPVAPISARERIPPVEVLSGGTQA